MRKAVLSLLLALLLAAAPALADLAWPSSMTAAQEKLQTYIGDVNEILIAQGAQPVNRLFECYSGFASLAVTASDDAEVPEGVEINITMDDTTLCVLTLRVSSVDQFIPLAAACIQAASPSMTWDQAKKEPESYAARISKSPGDSFSDTVYTLKGTAVQTYYAYAPNQYQDGVNWITMTLVFPLEGYEDNGVYVTCTPAPETGTGGGEGEDYEGYSAHDDYVHFEVITTETPSPDDGFIGN